MNKPHLICPFNHCLLRSNWVVSSFPWWQTPRWGAHVPLHTCETVSEQCGTLQGTVRTHRAIEWDPSVWLWSPKTVSRVPSCSPPNNTQEISFPHMLAKTGVMRHCFLLIRWVINGIFLLFVFSWLLLRCLLIYVGFPLCGWPIHILWPFRKITVFFFKKELIYFQLLLMLFSTVEAIYKSMKLCYGL